MPLLTWSAMPDSASSFPGAALPQLGPSRCSAQQGDEDGVYHSQVSTETVRVSLDGHDLEVCVDAAMDKGNSPKTIGWLMEETVRLATFNFANGNRRPVLRGMRLRGIMLKSSQIVEEALQGAGRDEPLEAVVEGWERLPIADRYVARCMEQNVPLNQTLLEKLKRTEGSEEEVNVSQCRLTDTEVRPLLSALAASEELTMLDLSDNKLGSKTVNGILEIVRASKETDLGLVLDLRNNQIGPSALLEICRCSVTLTRLESLDISGNRLTDAASRQIASLLKSSKVLVHLCLEGCALTTRSIQSIASALQSDSPLSKLAIGKNNPVSGRAMKVLLEKLCLMPSFTELDIHGIELDDVAAEAVGLLLCSSPNLISLQMSSTDLQDSGAIAISDIVSNKDVRLSRLEVASCGIGPVSAAKFCRQLAAVGGLSYLDISRNHVGIQGADILAMAVVRAGSRLKQLEMAGCGLGCDGVIRILQAAAGSKVLAVLNLSANFSFSKAVPSDIKAQRSNEIGMEKANNHDGCDGTVCDENDIVPDSDDDVETPAACFSSAGIGRARPSVAEAATLNDTNDGTSLPLSGKEKTVNDDADQKQKMKAVPATSQNIGQASSSLRKNDTTNCGAEEEGHVGIPETGMHRTGDELSVMSVPDANRTMADDRSHAKELNAMGENVAEQADGGAAILNEDMPPVAANGPHNGMDVPTSGKRSACPPPAAAANSSLGRKSGHSSGSDCIGDGKGTFLDVIIELIVAASSLQKLNLSGNSLPVEAFEKIRVAWARGRREWRNARHTECSADQAASSKENADGVNTDLCVLE
ncbi:hypothetical protein CBR_g36665 [Chara braunii]|uniref:Uncharacterized protein n=1 Tax=Chara braunii TaxID=69332 RepID=A0A388LL77_CHABU|nr:hypothetical protein CBR_g36665 [Chara braunii]|eukprot:GBG83047.1 hypothetical protein CBR_g36665 [Chara braunii]